jgi:hypothetical protein
MQIFECCRTATLLRFTLAVKHACDFRSRLLCAEVARFRQRRRDTECDAETLFDAGRKGIFVAGLRPVGHALDKALLSSLPVPWPSATKPAPRSRPRCRKCAAAVWYCPAGRWRAPGRRTALGALRQRAQHPGDRFERRHGVASAMLLDCQALIFVGVPFHLGEWRSGEARLACRSTGKARSCAPGRGQARSRVGRSQKGCAPSAAGLPWPTPPGDRVAYSLGRLVTPDQPGQQ